MKNRHACVCVCILFHSGCMPEPRDRFIYQIKLINGACACHTFCMYSFAYRNYSGTPVWQRKKWCQRNLFSWKIDKSPKGKRQRRIRSLNWKLSKKPFQIVNVILSYVCQLINKKIHLLWKRNKKINWLWCCCCFFCRYRWSMQYGNSTGMGNMTST